MATAPVFLPGESQGQKSLAGYSPWGHKESDTTERLPFHFSLSCTGEGNGNPLQCSCLENPRDGGVWWAAVYGIAQSWTCLKRLSSSSRATNIHRWVEVGRQQQSQTRKCMCSCVGLGSYARLCCVPSRQEMWPVSAAGAGGRCAQGREREPERKQWWSLMKLPCPGGAMCSHSTSFHPLQAGHCSSTWGTPENKTKILALMLEGLTHQ